MLLVNKSIRCVYTIIFYISHSVQSGIRPPTPAAAAPSPTLGSGGSFFSTRGAQKTQKL